MSLFDKLKTEGNLSLKGQQGPNFENESQRFSSDIQAFAKNNQLVSSQGMVDGRTYGLPPNRVKVGPSDLDLNGVNPPKYLSSNGVGFPSPLFQRLPFSPLGNAGLPLPTFENENQRSTSNIHANTSNNQLNSSQDLLTGRKYGTGRFTVFVQPSEPPISFPNGSVGKPFYPSLGGPYKSKGPAEGRY